MHVLAEFRPEIIGNHESCKIPMPHATFSEHPASDNRQALRDLGAGDLHAEISFCDSMNVRVLLCSLQLAVAMSVSCNMGVYSAAP